MIVIGIGALLTLIGFLCGAAATGQLTSGGSGTAYQAWLGAFFVLTGLGVFLTVGGWLLRTVMAARQARF
jgi:heme/copper-type cytochrome/quinol oxidase subunit 2